MTKEQAEGYLLEKYGLWTFAEKHEPTFGARMSNVGRFPRQVFLVGNMQHPHPTVPGLPGPAFAAGSWEEAVSSFELLHDDALAAEQEAVGDEEDEEEE